MMRQSKRVVFDPRNQTRKRIDITLEGFKLFAENKPNNVKLYLHMGIVDSHIHLQKYSRRIGVEKRIIVTSLHAGVQNVPIQRLNQIYNACDVGINTGLGEGFGLTNIEHAITGAPQVLADHSALKELYWDCGLMIPTTLPYTLDGIMTRGYLVKAEDVAQKLELLYTNKVLYDDLAKRGLEKFTSPEYSWKAITARFEKLIEELL